MSSTKTTIETPTGCASHSNIELKPVAPATLRDGGHLLGSKGSTNSDPAEFLPQPSTTVSVIERWNNPKFNIYRTFATLFAFTIMGANDAAYGVSLAIHFNMRTSH
jgi:hypothetical protein